MKKTLRKAHAFWVLFNMAFWFFLLWPPLYYFSRDPKRYRGMIRLRKIWAYGSTICSGIFFRFRFDVPVDWRRTYVICPNHTSNLDTAMLCILLPHANFSFMGKDTLRDGLLTGIFFRTVDIPVNRDSKMSSFRAFQAANERLQRGISMILFPEGGIADDYPPVVQEFKNGPFRMAIDRNAAVLPVTSADTWKVFWDDGMAYGSRPGIATVTVHRPIETANLTADDSDSLREQVAEIIRTQWSAVN